MKSGPSCMALWAITPELLMAGLGLALVPIAGWVRGRWRHLPVALAALGLVGAMVLTARMLTWEPTAVFCDTYAVDGFGTTFKLLLELGALITLFILYASFRDQEQVVQAPVAVIFSTLGGMGVASSLDLIMIVLFLQMLSLASYLLVGVVRTDPQGNEATIKYFIYAAAALAIMAYGFSFLYGLTGRLELRAIGAALLRHSDVLWIVVAAGLVLVGYAFDATIAPFHFWAPDVYEGATAPVTGFLSVVPKIAGFAGLLRFLLLALPGGLIDWPLAIAGLAVLTMTLGNLLALRQTRLKRLLAYSSIAQAGYVLMAVAVADRAAGAVTAAVYYLAAYLFMNLGAFAVVAQLERTVGSDLIAALRGFGRRAPGAAAVMGLSVLSLAGIPPLAGFAGKVLLLSAAIDGGLTWLAVIAIINMTVGLYYYAAVVAQMYFREPHLEWQPPSELGSSAALGVSLAGTLMLGILPGTALQLIGYAAVLLS